MKTFNTMLKIELKLSLRGMDMFIFAICMPALITVILGIIYGNKPAFDGADYTFFEQSFGALSTIAICAGGVMGLPLLVADYRHKKILKRFKVTPISPVMILLVHVVIYAIYALVSLIIVYLIASLCFNYHMSGSWFNFLGSYFLVMIAMFSIGVMVGGVASNMKTASTIASLLYFSMLVFSGTTLPYEMMPKSLQNFADFLPLTQGIKLLKAVSLNQPIDNILFSLTVLIILTILCATIALRFFKWE